MNTFQRVTAVKNEEIIKLISELFETLKHKLITIFKTCERKVVCGRKPVF